MSRFTTLLFCLASCVCPQEDLNFKQFVPEYVNYSEKFKTTIEKERNLADQLFSISRHPLTDSKYLQQLCFQNIRDACVVVKYDGDLLLYYPGKGMILSPSVIKLAQYQSQLLAALSWEYNRRILRLPLVFKDYTLGPNFCIDERPDPSPENLTNLNNLTFASSETLNPRALPLILDSLKNRATCKSLGYFVFQKNYYFNLQMGELRRKYANKKENITTKEYKSFYDEYFNNSST